MRLNVNPNRMELMKLKGRLESATRGHKLLKDKQDELIRRFIELARRSNKLRMEVENELAEAYKKFFMAATLQPAQFVEEALMAPSERISLEMSTENIMSIIVPKMEFSREGQNEKTGIFPYGFYNTSDETDRAIQKFSNLLPKLLELAKVEKSCELMADEIEKTRRRVNALEYMTIPNLTETIRYIKMKLDENERSNFIRLMKVKSMMDD
ncbi:MAG: V-type ATP synthase subunit D [Oscillospiraceae bacterium]|nr:V-type ATP synthase subunit D [Oscillospiraceae bacterium]